LDLTVRQIEALPRPLAGIAERVAPNALSAAISGLLGEVWQHLNSENILSTGHNVVLYNAPADPDFDALFGVEVHEKFAPAGRIVAAETPGGPVAMAVHWGEYTGLPDAHATVRYWLDAQGLRRAGPSWEIYGDWNDDPKKLRTDIFYLLEPAAL
jgi:effector-binding domain-containing protein